MTDRDRLRASIVAAIAPLVDVLVDRLACVAAIAEMTPTASQTASTTGYTSPEQAEAKYVFDLPAIGGAFILDATVTRKQAAEVHAELGAWLAAHPVRP